MATANLQQIKAMYGIVNKALDHLIGSSNTLEVYDTTSFTAVMETVKTLYETERVYGAINYVLMSTVFRDKSYSPKFDFIETDSEKFGLDSREIDTFDTYGLDIGDRIHVNENSTALVEPEPMGGSADPYKISQTVVPFELHVFGSNGRAEEVQYKKKDFYKCFTSETEMASFIAQQTKQFKRDMQIRKDAERQLLFLSYLAGLKESPNGEMSVNLLEAFRADRADYATATVADVIDGGQYQKEFSKWFSIWYRHLIEKMTMTSTHYHVSPRKTYHGHNLTYSTECPKEHLKAVFYDKFFTGIKTEVLSEVYNKDEIVLPDSYKTVPFWQDFVNEKGINVKAKTCIVNNNGDIESKNSASATAINYVVGALFDDRACQVVYKDDSTNSWENPRTGTLFYKADIVNTHKVDLTRKGVLMYLEDITA